MYEPAAAIVSDSDAGSCEMKLKDAWGMCAFVCLFWAIVVTIGYLVVSTLVPWNPGI